MSVLAIKGHVTRGKEIIEILEMLGGKNKYLHFGESESYLFFIQDGVIDCDEVRYADDYYIIYTLEEFLEKFPYKVGDKVIVESKESCGKVICMRWQDRTLLTGNKDGAVVYTVKLDTEEEITFLAEYLQPYKEEFMEGVYAHNEINCYHKYFGDKVRIRLGNNFEIKVEDNITYIVKKQPNYPKTYDECCKILDWNHRDYDRVGYNSELLCKLQVLLLCRDAYWKIAGELMGLDKPWEPDWINAIYTCTIICISNKVIKDDGFDADNRILAFPTEEMRDAFYENFKDLIEKCKELL